MDSENIDGEMENDREPQFDEPEDGTERANKVVEELGGLPNDNPFADLVRELRGEGETWQEVYGKLNDVFDVVDEASFEESLDLVPNWEVTTIVPDPDATSGERYMTHEWTAETASKAENEVDERKSGRVVREKTEQVGVSKLS